MNNKLFEEFLHDILLSLKEEENMDAFKEIENDEIKQKISHYKENLDLLDDCIFVDVMDELDSYNVDLKEFDDLLNKKELTESEIEYVEDTMSLTNMIIRQHIQDKINELTKLKDNF